VARQINHQSEHLYLAAMREKNMGKIVWYITYLQA